MQVDPLVSLLVGALGAAVIGLLGAWLQSLREHRRWLRERRFEAYRSFMIDMDTLSDLANTAPTVMNAGSLKKRGDALSEGFAESFESVSLLGPKEVNDAGQRWLWAANDLAEDKSSSDREAWRVARWEFLIAAGKELKSANVGDTPLTRPEVADEPATDVSPPPSDPGRSRH